MVFYFNFQTVATNSAILSKWKMTFQSSLLIYLLQKPVSSFWNRNKRHIYNQTRQSVSKIEERRQPFFTLSTAKLDLTDGANRKYGKGLICVTSECKRMDLFHFECRTFWRNVLSAISWKAVKFSSLTSIHFNIKE